jgi:hypothetical protein
MKPMPRGDLTKLQSILEIAEQSRDRLPPITTYRVGSVAKLELWLKRHFKRATRWYTWEQVNFNSEVHEALTTIVDVLRTYERQIAELKNQLGENQTYQGGNEGIESLNSRVRALETELEKHCKQSEQQFEKNQERITLLLEEQRVCFKQLTVQISEARFAADLTQRRSQSYFEELAARITAMEARETEIGEIIRALRTGKLVEQPIGESPSLDPSKPTSVKVNRIT